MSDKQKTPITTSSVSELPASAAPLEDSITSSLHEISLPGGWSLHHSSSNCGGPVFLQRHGQTVLSKMHSRFDSLLDHELAAGSIRFYHKGGQSVAQCDGRFTTGASVRLRQINRYAGNVGRMTLDLNWQRGQAVQHTAECGSLLLPGDWRRVLVIPSWHEMRDGKQAQWLDLTPGQEMILTPMPLAVVCERNDGLLVENSLGFDVWRWQYGLGKFDAAKSSLRLQRDQQATVLRRQLLTTDAEVIPEAREYRFCWQLAWLDPADKTAPDFPAQEQRLSWNGNQGLSMNNEGADPKQVTYVVDFNDLPAPKEAQRDDGSDLPCWESNATQGVARRAIRQIAALRDQGFLRLQGLTPGLCARGMHCNRKQEAAHWDLQGILTFAVWARQTLGDKWVVDTPQELSPWQSLPSLAAPLAVTGFRVMNDE